MIDETNKPTTTLLEDLEDLVGQLQRDKLTEKQAVEILSNIVKYEKEESKWQNKYKVFHKKQAK